jgi:hypothetical protein
MKLAAFVALWLSPTVFRLTSTELAKVFGCLGHHILVQFHFDPPQLLPCSLMSVFHGRHDGPPRAEATTGIEPRKTRVENGAGRGGRYAGWRKMRAGIPPRVTSKKTTGLTSVVSAMVVAVQYLLAAAFVWQDQMTLTLHGC